MKRSTTAACCAAGDQVEDHLGVGGRLEDRALRDQLVAQREGVGQVAVVGDGEAAEVELGEQRLDVAQDRAAGGGVADVADGGWPGRRSITGAGEVVADQAEWRSEWKCRPSKETMPAASWPRCCRACRPSAVSAAASGWPKMPNTPHSSCRRSSSRGRASVAPSGCRSCASRRLPQIGALLGAHAHAPHAATLRLSVRPCRALVLSARRAGRSAGAPGSAWAARMALLAASAHAALGRCGRIARHRHFDGDLRSACGSGSDLPVIQAGWSRASVLNRQKTMATQTGQPRARPKTKPRVRSSGPTRLSAPWRDARW